MFPSTTLGKSLKVVVYAGVSAALSALIKVLTDLSWGDLVWLQPAVNTALVALKNLFDPQVPNY